LKNALAGIKIKILENIGMSELQTEITIGFIGIFGVLIGTILTYFVDKLRINYEENKNILRRVYYNIYTNLKYCFLTDDAFKSGHKSPDEISIIDMEKQIEELLESNIDIIDNSLFTLYHKLKMEQYYNDPSAGVSNYRYLNIFAELLKNMRGTQKKLKMIDKYFDKDIKELYYSYKLWFALMSRFQDWILVENILNKDFRMKYTRIYNSLFFKRWNINKKQNIKESIEAFEKYCVG
jgi:hypothetical protein